MQSGPSKPSGDAFFGESHDVAPDKSEAPIDIGRYIDSLRKRWWMVALSALIAVGVALAYTSRQPRLYRAQATIIIDSSTNSNILNGVQDVVQLGTGGFWASEAFYEKEYRIARSSAVARRAGEILGVLADDEWTGLDKIKDPLERDKRRVELDPADFILGTYTVEPEKTKNIVHIAVLDMSRERSAKIANAVAQAYMELNGERRLDGTRDAGSQLYTRHSDVNNKLNASEDALYEFMEQNGVLNASLESQLSAIQERARSFEQELASVEAKRIHSQTDMLLLKKAKQNSDLADLVDEVQTSAVIIDLKAAIHTIERERDALDARYQADHPKMIAVAQTLASAKARLTKEVKAILDGIEGRHLALADTEKGMAAKLADVRSKEARLNKLQKNYRRLKREVESNERMFTMVTTRMKETEQTGALYLNNVSVLENAEIPGGAFRPSYRNNLTIGGVLGLIFGLLLIVLFDILDNTVKSREDLEVCLPGAPFLGIVPIIDIAAHSKGEAKAAYHQERDLYIMKHPKSTAAECLRFIRSNLMFMTPDKPLRTVMVTSPSPREGKTTAAINLAVTMAQSDNRILIVDTDMRRPRIHRALGVGNERGLSSCIVGDATLDEAVQATDAPGLDVLVCGPVPPNPAELLHTQSFTTLIEEMKTKYDRVIFDSPPLGAVTDPVIVGTKIDGTILVVKCQETSKASARQAYRTLKDANVSLFGCLLNDVDLEAKQHGGEYYRRYGYYYGESSATPETGAKA